MSQENAAQMSPTDVERIRSTAEAMIGEVEKVILGKRSVIELAVIAMLCEGHVLLEDVPGLGKTMLARSLANSVGGQFGRVQFTPDLLPGDITGSLVFNPQTGQFTFREGPIVTNILLADEINRAGPRTQSALLEAMEERQISVERQHVSLPRPFFVIATQNPVELEGTFPLPEAQLDRFLMRLSIGYPTDEDERAMLQRFRADEPLVSVAPVVTTDDLVGLIALVRRVHVSAVVDDYIVRLIRSTRGHATIDVGASPRAMLALARAAQAYAATHGRGFVRPDDVRELAKPVLAHRLISTPEADLAGMSNEKLIDEVIAGVPVPVEEETVD